MEDIDKNGDGFIDLDEYIGEARDFHHIILFYSSLWMNTEMISICRICVGVAH